jgi:hypothetical protein
VTWFETLLGRGPDDVLPGYKLKRNPSNDYLIDREMQRTKNYSGIVGINTQDFALQEGMGRSSTARASTSGPATVRSSRCAGCCSKRRATSKPAATRKETFARELLAKW